MKWEKWAYRCSTRHDQREHCFYLLKNRLLMSAICRQMQWSVDISFLFLFEYKVPVYLLVEGKSSERNFIVLLNECQFSINSLFCFIFATHINLFDISLIHYIIIWLSYYFHFQLLAYQNRLYSIVGYKLLNKSQFCAQMALPVS